MTTFKLEINLNDIVEDMFCDASFDHDCGYQPSGSFSDAVQSNIISSTARQLKDQVSQQCLEEAKILTREAAQAFIDKELEGIITRKLRSGELKSSWKGFESFEALINDRISRIDIDRVIRYHIDEKASSFAKDLKSRYDNVFAAKVVQNLSKQKMLSPEISKILLGE